jgi:hypothetical protein
MPSDVVALVATEALKQRLDALVAATEEMAACRLLDEEQVTAVKKLVPGPSSSSAMTNSSSYEDTIIANLRI